MNRRIMKVRIIQDNLYLMHTSIEKVDDQAALINLDQSKAITRLTVVSWKLSCLRFTSKPTFAFGFACCMRFQSCGGDGWSNAA